MAAFLHPGVYVVETPNPARSIEAASTSITIFAGPTERGPLSPTLLTARGDYTRLFGGYLRGTSASSLSPTLAYAMDAFFANGGSTAYVLPMMKKDVAATPIATAARSVAGVSATFRIVASSPGTWPNAYSWTVGTRVYTGGLYAVILPSSDIPIPTPPATLPSPTEVTKFRILVVYTAPGSNVAAIVEDWDRLSTNPEDQNYVVDALNRSLYIRYEKPASGIVTGPAAYDLTTVATQAGILALAFPGGPAQLSGGFGGTVAPDSGDYDLSLLDDVLTASLLVLPSVGDDSMADDLIRVGIDYVSGRVHRDLFFIADLARHNNQALTSQATSDVVTEFGAFVKSDLTALYWPWVEVSDPVGIGKNPTIKVGPSAHVAGVYARIDDARGPWKAPAGIEATLTGVISTEFNVQDVHQDILNPIGINAVRVQTNTGPVVWGARTMVPAGQWRYIPVRRMAIFLRQSIYNGIQFAVFEPNDEPLWSGLRQSIGGFLDRLFRVGAFAGASRSEAYFVKVDKETTTPDDQIAGVVNVLVGFAPLRPAEFVVVKLSQITTQSST